MEKSEVIEAVMRLNGEFKAGIIQITLDHLTYEEFKFLFRDSFVVQTDYEGDMTLCGIKIKKGYR